MYGPIKVHAVTTSPFSHVGPPTFSRTARFVTLLQLSISLTELVQDVHLLNVKRGWIVSIHPCLKLLQEPPNISNNNLLLQLWYFYKSVLKRHDERN